MCHASFLLRKVQGVSHSKIAEPRAIPRRGRAVHGLGNEALLNGRVGAPLNKVHALNFFSLSSFPINTGPVVQQAAQAFRPTATGLIQRTLE